MSFETQFGREEEEVSENEDLTIGHFNIVKCVINNGMAKLYSNSDFVPRFTTSLANMNRSGHIEVAKHMQHHSFSIYYTLLYFDLRHT